MSSHPLRGLTVVEVSAGYAAGLCGRLLQRHGATVTRVVVDGREDVDFATRAWLDQGKRVTEPADPAGLEAADIIIVDMTPSADRGTWDPERLGREQPRSIITSITPFGESGPWRGYRVDALTLDALSGLSLLRGPADRPPVTMARYVADLLGGLTAYAGTTAALIRRERGLAGGEIVDVSLFESVLAFSEGTWSGYAYQGRVNARGAANSVAGMTPCSDGYCMGFLWGVEAWKRFGALLGDEDFYKFGIAGLITDPDAIAAARRKVVDWFQGRTKAEATRIGQDLHLTFGYSATIPDLLADPQLEARRVLQPLEVGGKALRMPDAPFAIESGNDRAGSVNWPATGSAPLSGVTVVELTAYWAGPLAARLLADLGANVIKVEGPSHPDPVRTQMPKDGIYREEDKWERGWWNGFNVGKRSLALELGTSLGRELILKLIARADVVFENLSRKVVESFGLDWAQLRQVSDTVSLVSSSAFGRTGPFRHYIAFGVNLEPMSGTSEFAGYPDGPPELVASNVSDPMAALASAGVVLTVLFDRLRSASTGAYVDLAQRDVLISALPAAFAEYQLTGKVPARTGNSHADAPVHDCFPCAGLEQYVAISCKTPDERDSLCRVIGYLWEAGQGQEDPARVAALTAAVAEWCRGRSKFEVFHALQAAGVVAAPLLDAQDIDANPQLAARGFFRPITTADGFPMRAMTYGFRFTRNPLELTSRVPRFGEHNADVLGWVGIDAASIAEAERKGVIADRPTADFPGTVAAPLTRPS